MAENNQLSDETKNNSTDTSSTDASSAVIGNHENAIVPHKISNHDKLVQTMVMVDGEWINVNDTNDQANTKEDVHKVNKKVVEAQKGIVEAKNAADSAVKYADSAVSASKVNSDAIAAQSSAISEAKAAADDAASKAQFIKENASSEAAAIRNQVADVANNVSSVKADVASAASDVANLKVDVQANSAAIIKTNEAVSIQSKSSSDAINELKIANGQVESIAKDAKNNATVAKQTANAATIVAQDAKSNAVVAKQTASSATIEATNATSTASKAELSVNGLTTRVDGIEGDTKKLSGRVTSTETILQQTKDQLLQKADKSVVDQANNLISQLSSEQKIMAGQISQKVSSSDYQKDKDDTITSIEKNTTAIDENSKAIKLKADATEVNNLKGTVTSHSASINLFSDQLKSMVTESKVNDIINGKGFTTQNTVQSLIDQKSNTISESIVKLSNDVRNNGGGINLLRSTDVFSKAYWIYDNIENQHKDSLVELGKVGTADSRIYQSLSIETTKHVFSVSFDAQISDDCTDTDVIVSCGPYDALQNVHVSGKDLKHYKVENWTWAGTSNNFSLYVRNGKIRLSKLKLEYGPVATPYAPAPSDNASVNQLQSVTASIDGLQSAVKNKVDQSQYTQLAGVVQTKVSQSDFNRLNNQVNVQTLDSANIDNMKTTGHYFVHNLTGNPIGGWVYVDVNYADQWRIRQDVYQDGGTKHAFRRWFGSYWTEWSTGAEESEITQLRNDINLRVKSGDLLSQINIAAGHTLIQSNKIYFDADSFVMSPNSTAFIPSAYITDINADKINTGTLHSISINNGNGTFRVDPDGNVYANSMHVNNGSIYQGTVLGADVYSISNLTSNSLDEVNDATQNWVKLKDGIIELHGANGDHYSSIVPVDVITTYAGEGGSTDVHHGLGILDSREVIIGSASLDSEHSNRITHSRNFSVISRTHLGITNSYIQAQLDPDVEYGKGARFSIQKDNKVGFYVGGGDNGNEIIITGAGPIKLQGRYIYDGFDDGITHTLGSLQVDNLHVKKWLGVDNNKNAIVKTSQGTVAINAYETAEYYFGDIGEGQTDSNGVAYVGIEKLFNETVNTSIPYQVFITAYGPGNVWVEQREQDRFMVKSSQPNIKFGWEIKAKRKGYEHTRLQNVDNKLNHMEATS